MHFTPGLFAGPQVDDELHEACPAVRIVRFRRGHGPADGDGSCGKYRRQGHSHLHPLCRHGDFAHAAGSVMIGAAAQMHFGAATSGRDLATELDMAQGENEALTRLY